MATTTWPSSIGHINMSTCRVMFTRVILIEMHPYQVKYSVDYLHISPNCQYIPSSISESHGSPKTNFTALKEKGPKNI